MADDKIHRTHTSKRSLPPSATKLGYVYECGYEVERNYKEPFYASPFGRLDATA